MRRLLKARELGLPEGDTSTLEGLSSMAAATDRQHGSEATSTQSALSDQRWHCCAKCCASAVSKRNAPSCTAPRRSAAFFICISVKRPSPSAQCRPSTPDDAIVATYREHGHALARGIPAGAIMAEMFGKREGCSRGRGGSMHLFDAAMRFYGGNAIVGGGLPLAVGLALADKMQQP